MRTLDGAEVTLARLLSDVERTVGRLGVMFRVFGRAKSEPSIRKKIDHKKYAQNGRLLQDLIGIRVVVYFAEDCEIVQKVICKQFSVADETVDIPASDEFGPRRLNLVLRVPDAHWYAQMEGLPIDRTFELQIRTVLSEGWHEVEHDLRYKCSGDWDDVPEKLRTLNGTLATLETAEWAMGNLFERLAYHHYKAARWEPMLRHKFRIRLQDGCHLDARISELFDSDRTLSKRIFRVDRGRLIAKVAASQIELPWTFDNLVHLVSAIDGIAHAPLMALRTNYVAECVDAAFGG